uniref:Desmoplakin a n=1 Tax=Gadus morhua TaxID=8049 RepID=A0A8C5BXW8_GADMO
MSMYDSQSRMNTLGQRSGSRPDLSGASFRNDCGPMMHVGGNGYQGEYNDGYNQVYTSYSKSSMHGGGGSIGGGQQKMVYSTGGPAMEVEKLLSMSSESLEQLRRCANDLQQLRVPHDLFRRYHAGKAALPTGAFLCTQPCSSVLQRLIETAPWGDDAEALDQQTISHNKFHNSIQRSVEVDRARDELNMSRDKPRLNTLEQEWSSLQKMSDKRFSELRELQGIIEEISRAIMWVNEREEEELVFDWGDKNIEQYIPRKQEGYSKMMSALEEKEKELNKLKTKVDGLLNKNHPASDKIEAYMDTLQTQWSWLLQITKCIHVHLKENAAYHQFFKEANETYGKLQKQHEHVRNKFTCDKQTSLESLLDLLKDLEKEKEKIMENKRQVQSLVTKSKSIVRLKPRNPEERSSSTVMVQALCDFKQDQKSILKGNEGILKDNSQRSKWQVTGPGGLDMLIPSVCLLIPPPNPLSIGLANKNEQYYEAIMGIWNQLYINIKSLIAWQYCSQDINYINSLTLTMLSKMRPDEYRTVIKRLETHYQEFLRTSQGSELFGEEEQKNIKGQFAFAQNHYDGLIVQLPTYSESFVPVVKPTVPSPTETSVKVVKVTKVTAPPPAPAPSTLSLSLLNDLDALRRRLEVTESSLTYHLHLPLGENSVRECSLNLQKLQVVSKDLDALHDEYIRLRERILKQLDGIPADSEQAKYLRSQLDYINLRIGDLQGLNNSYFNRLSCLKGVLQNMNQVQDVVQVNEVLLTEKDTTSLDTREVDEYRSTLKQMRLELDQKRDLLSAMDSELASAVQYNSQISRNFHKCDVDLTKYAEQVGQLNDRWSRIRSQIDSRLWDLEKQDKELRDYHKSSGNLETWIDNTRIRQDSLQTVKFTDIPALMDHLNQQKVLYNEIKGKHEKVEDVQKDAEICASSIKDYELQLASYSAGLETLLNVPIKRTMLKSPASTVRQEATVLHSSYVELLTRSGDYHKFLGEMLKSMEELKMRNTRIELLEEELRRLKESFQDRNHKNQSLEDALARYKLELSQSKEKLISLEEVKMTSVIQVNATRESLDSTQNQLKDLNDKLSRLQYQLDEEVRKRRLAEERYTSQQEEYESAVRRRQKELEEVNWSKIDLEKLVKDKERELERLKIQLEEEAARRRGAESEMSKTSMMIHESKSSFTELKQEREGLLSKMKMMEQDKIRQQRIEEELTRIKLSLETELRNKQRLTEENTSVRKDLAYFKSQFELRDSEKRQGDSDRDRADRERASMKSEVERLTRELRTLEETYKSQRLISEKESREMTLRRQTLEKEILMLQQRPSSLSRQTQTSEKVSTIDPSKLLFDGGIRSEVTMTELVASDLLSTADLEKVYQGTLTSQDIEDRLKNYLYGSSCIAGIYDEAKDRTMSFYMAMKEGLIMRGTTLELLEAQAASGFIIDPVNNVFLTVEEAVKRGVVGNEFKKKLISAEKAVVGYTDPETGNTISLFQAIDKDLIEKGHGIRLLEAQIASGGIIDPKESHRIDVDVAYRRGYFNKEMNEILTYEGDDTKGFFDPNTKDNLTYLQLKERCIKDPKTGLVLLALRDKSKKPKDFSESRKNVLRKRRVVIVDPDTGLEMSVREAFHRELIDYDTFLDLSEQECEWEEITVKGEDGSVRVLLVDKKTGTQYDINEYLERGAIDQASLDRYRSGNITLTEFADLITQKSSSREMSITASTADDVATCTSPTQARPSSPTVRKRFNSISITLSPAEMFDDLSPVGAIFDTETLEKITISEACRRGIVDNITAQRLLEAQASTGGIINPSTGQRLSLQDAVHQTIIDEDMAPKLKASQKAFTGFEDVKSKRRMSAAEAMKEKWLPYEAGQRFLEFQYLTGGLLEPGSGRRISMEEAIRRKWLDGREAQKLQDTQNHQKNLTCPKTKLKISYKQAMDGCMVEESNGMKMLQATSISSKGISSPYNVSNPGSRSGSRQGSRAGSRRGSVDYSSSYSLSVSSSSVNRSFSNSSLS